MTKDDPGPEHWNELHQRCVQNAYQKLTADLTVAAKSGTTMSLKNGRGPFPYIQAASTLSQIEQANKTHKFRVESCDYAYK